MITILIVILLLGLVVGSFLNVIIIRSQKSESLGGRSKCQGCGKTLNIIELIPILSFLLQKGRCRNCGSALSLQYPIVEGSTGILFALASWYIFNYQFPFILDSLFVGLLPENLLLAFGFWLLALIAISAAVVIFVSDILYFTIPNGAFLVLLSLGVILRLYIYWPAVGSNLVKDLGAAIFFALLIASLWFFSKGRWMGLGDAKLILATSLILGHTQAISAFLFSFWLGGLAGILLLLFRLKSLTDHIPFGPFIIIGSVLAYFFSDFFLSYTNLYPLF